MTGSNPWASTGRDSTSGSRIPSVHLTQLVVTCMPLNGVVAPPHQGPSTRRTRIVGSRARSHACGCGHRLTQVLLDCEEKCPDHCDGHTGKSAAVRARSNSPTAPDSPQSQRRRSSWGARCTSSGSVRAPRWRGRSRATPRRGKSRSRPAEIDRGSEHRDERSCRQFGAQRQTARTHRGRRPRKVGVPGHGQHRCRNPRTSASRAPRAATAAPARTTVAKAGAPATRTAKRAAPRMPGRQVVRREARQPPPPRRPRA